MALDPGSKLGPYEILSPLGAGGMGEVYVARDSKLDRRVAVKILPERFSEDGAFRARFEREAKALGALSHPNILSVYDFGNAGDVSYTVTELLEGETLGSYLRSRAVSTRQAVDVALQVASGLAAAHDKGIVHRDLKPDNIFINNDGRVKILDFGLAKQAAVPEASEDSETTARDTAPGAVLGTVGYMSPEQVRGLDTDARSDLFSLGAVLYEMLVGKAPFAADSAADSMSAVLNKEIDVSADRRISPGLARVLSRCLEKNRSGRFQTARDLAFALENLTDLGSNAGQRTPGAMATPNGRGWLLVAGAAVLATAAALAAWWWLRSASTPSQARTSQISVAVLPFANLGADPENDFLRLALADEVATALTYAPALAVRPLSVTRRYAEQETDALDAGRELRVENVVTGEFAREADQMRVSLEAIDVAGERLLWRSAFSTPLEDVIAVRNQVAQRLRDELLPQLGVTPKAAPATTPTNREAYALYLRAVAASSDPEPNRRAIELLERSTTLDPTFAPAWALLGSRYSYDAAYADGGDSSFRRADAAAAQALLLDPELLDASVLLTLRRVERGEIEAAFVTARALVERRPESAYARFALAYALRYGGMFEESVEQCERAAELDPLERRTRSCGLPLASLGRFDRAREFYQLDAGSNWSQLNEATSFLREGRREDARRAASAEAAGPVLDACLDGRTASEAERRADIDVIRRSRDGEQSFYFAGTAALCGGRAAALELLEHAVELHFCVAPPMDWDPAFADVRDRPEFAAVRAAGLECHERFTAFVAANGGIPSN